MIRSFFSIHRYTKNKSPSVDTQLNSFNLNKDPFRYFTSAILNILFQIVLGATLYYIILEKDTHVAKALIQNMFLVVTILIVTTSLLFPGFDPNNLIPDKTINKEKNKFIWLIKVFVWFVVIFQIILYGIPNLIIDFFVRRFPNKS